MPKEKCEQLFLAFYSYVANRTKLIDSEMYIVADGNYSRLYREILAKEGRYDGGVMNEIHGEFINSPKEEICKILKQE